MRVCSGGADGAEGANRRTAVWRSPTGAEVEGAAANAGHHAEAVFQHREEHRAAQVGASRPLLELEASAYYPTYNIGYFFCYFENIMSHQTI